MNETIQASGWWLASDGNWYPPEQYTGTPATVLADAAPVQKGLSKGMTVLIGLAVILVLAVGAVGGTRFLVGGSSGTHWSSATKQIVVSGCVDDGSSQKSCKCFADELEKSGVTESELMTLGSLGTPAAMMTQPDAMSHAVQAVGKCGISTSSSSSSNSSTAFGSSDWNN